MTPLGPFRGIDRRPGAADSPGALYDALNTIVSSEGGLVRRPAATVRATLPADSIGIYSVGDQLRTLAPYQAGDETEANALAPTCYVDFITDQGKALSALLGQVSASDGRTLALLRYADESTDMHFCPDFNTAPAAQTRLDGLGFTPNYSLIQAAGRAFVLDNNLRYLRFSNLDSANPALLADFLSNQDLTSGSGFLEVSQFAAGAGQPLGLGIFGGQIVVFYRGAMLIYRIDVDQSRYFLSQVVKGPGTQAPRSVVELGSDTIFLSDPGVRVLSDVSVSLDARTSAFGGHVDPLAMELADNINVTPIGHYARRLGCYLLAFGQDVLCLSVLPGSAVLGWTRWRLPVPVEGWAEAGGLTWFRSGRTLYALEDGEDRDETALGVYADIPVFGESLPYRSGTQQLCQAVASACTEPLQVQVVADGRPVVAPGGGLTGMPMTLPPRAPEPSRALSGKMGRMFSLRFYDPAAVAGWRLDNLWIDVTATRAS